MPLFPNGYPAPAQNSGGGGLFKPGYLGTSNLSPTTPAVTKPSVLDRVKAGFKKVTNQRIDQFKRREGQFLQEVARGPIETVLEVDQWLKKLPGRLGEVARGERQGVFKPLRTPEPVTPTIRAGGVEVPKVLRPFVGTRNLNTASAELFTTLTQFGMNPRTAADIAPPVAAVLVAMDLSPAGVARKGFQQTAKQIAKSTDVEEILTLLRPFSKGTESEVRPLAQLLVEVNDPRAVQEFFDISKRLPIGPQAPIVNKVIPKSLDGVTAASTKPLPKTISSVELPTAKPLPTKIEPIINEAGQIGQDVAGTKITPVVQPLETTVVPKIPKTTTPVQPLPTTRIVETPPTKAPIVTKPSKVAKSIEAKAIEKGLTEEFKDLAGFETVNIKDQASMMSKIMKEDIERGKRLALAQEDLPQGLKAETALKAVEDYAMETRDAGLLRDLAKSPVATRISESAQSLRLAGERVPDSATAQMREVIKARQKAVEAKTGGRKASNVQKEIKASVERAVKKAKPTKKSFARFVDELTCK